MVPSTSPPAPPLPRLIALSRFALSGGLCFVVGTALLWVATDCWHFHYLISTFGGSIATNALGFTLNRRWAFADRATRFWRELGRYYLVNFGSLLLNLGLMALFVSGLKVPYLVASMGLSVVLSLSNFVLHRNWSFGAR